MIDDEDVHDFLEHHGVLGMRWGSRKAGNSGSNNSGSSKKSMSPKVKFARNLAIGVAGGILVGAFLGRYLGTSLRNIPKPKVDLTTPFLAKYGNTPMTVWHQPGPFQISKHLR